MFRQVAIGDAVLFGVLAVPGLGPAVIAWLVQLNTALGLGGTMAPGPVTDLLVNLLGVLGLAFALTRLITGPMRRVVQLSIAVKVAAAGLFALAVFHAGAPQVFLLLLLADLTAAIALALTAGRHAPPQRAST